MLPILLLEAGILLGIVLILLRSNPLGSISSSLRILDEGIVRLSSSSEHVEAALRAGFQEVHNNQAAGLGQLRGDAIAFFEQMRRDASEMRELMTLKLEKAASDAASRHSAFIEHFNTKLAAIGPALSEGQAKQSEETLRMKETVELTLNQLGLQLRDGAQQLTEEVRSRLKDVAAQMNALSETNERRQEGLRQTVEARLEKLQDANAAKLEEMRATVDEKLQATLEKRLNDSFSLVAERLENVQTGLGEMKELAVGVGDLKRVLTNVRARGTMGETQCGAQLDQVLSPDQYIRNAVIKEGSSERVEFAIRIPSGDKGETLLPIEVKFPKEDWERLEESMDHGSAEAIAAAREALVATARSEAQKIAEKYIDPPRTTPFALMYVPTEGLFAELIRVPGLIDDLQTHFQVSVAGPANFVAILNSLQMGFRTVAIQRKGAEVWRVLGAAKMEFRKFGGLMSKVESQVDTVQSTLREIRGKTKTINRTLREVSALEMQPAEASGLLGIHEQQPLPLAAEKSQAGEMAASSSGEDQAHGSGENFGDSGTAAPSARGSDAP